jgi:hypothetical protein
MDRTKSRERSSPQWEINPNTQKYDKGYLFGSALYKKFELWFYCKDKSLYCQTVPASSIGNYPVKTLEELEAYLSNFTEQQKVDYFDNLQKIYIVEVFPNSDIIEVVEVELSIYEL